MDRTSHLVLFGFARRLKCRLHELCINSIDVQILKIIILLVIGPPAKKGRRKTDQWKTKLFLLREAASKTTPTTKEQEPLEINGLGIYNIICLCSEETQWSRKSECRCVSVNFTCELYVESYEMYEGSGFVFFRSRNRDQYKRPTLIHYC